MDEMSETDETLREIHQGIGRIEAKVDSVKDTISKVVYALLAIVAATVGVEFFPKSPINILAGIEYTTRFLTFFTYVFVPIMIYKTRKKAGKTHNWLACAFIGMAVLFFYTIIVKGASPYITIPVRIMYNAFLLFWAWKLKI
jgi:hypothetical protein